jgi:hypothetical protein
MKSSEVENLSAKLEACRKEYKQTPKVDRPPLRLKFKQIQNDLKSICSHKFISECFAHERECSLTKRPRLVDSKRICETCGLKEEGMFLQLKDKTNIIQVDSEKFIDISNNFNKFK